MNRAVHKCSNRRNTFARQSLSFLAMFVVLLAISGLLQAAVTGSLDRDTIYTGDTVTLRITTTGDQQGEQPDLTPLQKDFEVIGTSTSRRIQIINGQRSDKDEWLIELAPLRKGTLAIPPLSVRNSATPALTVQVNEQPAASTAEAGQPVFVSAEINPPEGDTYVQQQILYTTRLYYRVPLIEGSLSDPQIENAVVERLGKDQQYETTIDGQSYQVVERHYAVFPEHSGELTIGATTFSGRSASTSDQQSRFGSMDNIVERMLSQRGLNESLVTGKRIRVRSDPLILNIKPRPDVYTGAHWLPSQKLVLRDSWAETPPVIRAGEPVTRLLTIDAKGMEASQLPEIRLPESDTLRVYPEQPELSNRSDGDWIYGRSEQRFTYVVTHAGKLELPEVHIEWWDSINHKPQTTTLPAREIMVKPGVVEPQPENTGSDVGSATSDAADRSSNTQDTITVETDLQRYPHYWIAGGVLVLLAAILLIRKRRSPASGRLRTMQARPADTQPTSDSINSDTLAHTRKALKNACSRNDAQIASRALLDWAAATWPHQPPRSLGALARRVDRGTDEIRGLEQTLYSTANNRWTGQSLWEVFMLGLQAPEKPGNTSKANRSVPPLYPDWHEKAGSPGSLR